MSNLNTFKIAEIMDAVRAVEKATNNEAAKDVPMVAVAAPTVADPPTTSPATTATATATATATPAAPKKKKKHTSTHAAPEEKKVHKKHGSHHSTVVSVTEEKAATTKKKHAATEKLKKSTHRHADEDEDDGYEDRHVSTAEYVYALSRSGDEDNNESDKDYAPPPSDASGGSGSDVEKDAPSDSSLEPVRRSRHKATAASKHVTSRHAHAPVHKVHRRSRSRSRSESPSASSASPSRSRSRSGSRSTSPPPPKKKSTHHHKKHAHEDDDAEEPKPKKARAHAQRKPMDLPQTYQRYAERLKTLSDDDFKVLDGAYVSDFGLTTKISEVDQSKLLQGLESFTFDKVQHHAAILCMAAQARGVHIKGFTDENFSKTSATGWVTPLPNNEKRIENGGTERVIYTGKQNTLKGAQRKATLWSLSADDIVKVGATGPAARKKKPATTEEMEAAALDDTPMAVVATTAP